jgi:glycosyltransferase involved in cell wall biosynthesis
VESLKYTVHGPDVLGGRAGARNGLDGGPIRALFASHLWKLIGGAEQCLFELVRALAQTERVYPIVSVPRQGEFTDALAQADIPFVVVPTLQWTPSDPKAFEGIHPWHGPVRRARLTTSLLIRVLPYAAVIRATRPNVVVTNTATIPTPALACALLRKPHIWLLHEFVTLDHHLPYLLGERLSQHLIGRFSAAVVANSSAVRQHFAPRVPLSKSRVIYPGIPACRARENRITPGELRVLLLGHQTATKGTELAVRAVARLASEEPRFRLALRLVGFMAPDYQRAMTELCDELGVSDAVTMFEFTADPTSHFEWSNVVLMCSENEAFGRVTAEALKCGRPVVGTRSGGTPEIVTDGVDGLLFEPGDVRGLASCLSTLGSDQNLLATLSNEARYRSSARFLMEDEVEQFSRLLASVAAKDVR